MPNSVAPTLKVSPATSARRRRPSPRRDPRPRAAGSGSTRPQDRDAAALADPVEQDLEDAEPLRADERLRPRTITTSRPAPRRSGRTRLAVDLRLAVVPDADERRVLGERVLLRDPVDRGRRDRRRPRRHARLERGGERAAGAVDVDRADRVARGLDRQRRGRVDEHVGARDEPGHVGAVAHVAVAAPRPWPRARVVERREVEGPHLVAVRRRAAARGAGRGSPRRRRSPTAPCPTLPRRKESRRDGRFCVCSVTAQTRRPVLAPALAGLALAAPAKRLEPADRGASGRPARIRALHRPDRLDRRPRSRCGVANAFQRRAGLVPDGRAGPSSGRARTARPPLFAAAPAPAEVRLGPSAPSVHARQA